ncbi:MAG TPA: hypothetical protein VFI74_02655 [Candidatus Saccharimonadales bacterium]|nr:hypothetical protein [Candidatus Saccharimonadales bacterium]
MMFGHDHHQNDDNNQNQTDGAVTHPDAATTTSAPGVPPVVGTPQSSQPGEPAAPATEDNAGDYIMTDAPSSAPAPAPTSSSDDDMGQAPVSAPAPAGSDDLLNIKQQALQQLSPLVSHLDQAPEDEFRTTMMLIQSSDNKDLIPQAYKAAQAITDDKARAQALLDVVNEINYFTQHEQNS